MKAGKRHATFTLIAVFLLIFGAFSSQAFTGGWIKFAGIEGESQDKDHKEWIDIESGSPMVTSMKSGLGTAAKASGQGEISVSILPDKSMPRLQTCYQSHCKLSQVEIDSPPDHFVLRNVVIASILPQVDQKTGKQLRVLKLQYESIQYK
jgi:type VI protein secretion system component Hcp